ncbi:MAG: nucleotide exchange factor GrpE [Magnetococcus sp. DMHC-6]
MAENSTEQEMISDNSEIEETTTPETPHEENELIVEQRLKALESELEQARSEALQNRSDYLRAIAEMENLRKRTEKEKEKAHKFAIEGFANDLLTLADNVDRALAFVQANPEEFANLPPKVKSMLEGVHMLKGEIQRTFNKHGIQSIAVLNLPFDPNFHQAVSQVSDSTAASGSVVQELQTGYTLNGRLLRPSLVNVAQ